MSVQFSGINKDDDHFAKFISQFCKVTELPQSRFIKVFMHPTDANYVVTVNSVIFPKIDSANITTYVNGEAAQNLYRFEETIRETYMPMVAEHDNFHPENVADKIQEEKKVQDDDLLEPGDSIFSDFEGGDSEEILEEEKELEDEEKQWAKYQGQKRNKKELVNLIDVTAPPRMKGKYEKVTNVQYLKKKEKERAILQKQFNLSVDMFLNENILEFTKDDIDRFHMYADQKKVDDENDSLNDTESLSDYSFEEKVHTGDDEDKYLEDTIAFMHYEQLPDLDGCRYIPQSFRHKFEICYWKLNAQNVVKVKSYYFTPRGLTDVEDYSASISLDKTHICVVSKQKNSKKSKVSIFPIKSFVNEDEKRFIGTVEYEKREQKYRRPIELDVETFDNVPNPFGKDDAITTPSFNFTNNDLNGRDENHGINIVCWDRGRYVMSKITQSAKLHNGFAFKIYDTTTKEVVSYIHRKHDDLLTEFIYDIRMHPKDHDKLVFIMNTIENFDILEVDVVNAKISQKQRVKQNVELITSIKKSTDFIDIDDSFEHIYVCHENEESDSHELHQFSYQKQDSMAFTKKSRMDDVGTVKLMRVNKSYVYLNVVNTDGTTTNKIYKERKFYGEIKNKKFGDVISFDIIEQRREMIFIDKATDNKVILRKSDFLRANKGDLNKGLATLSDNKYRISEITEVMYDFPNIFIIKGGYELMNINMTSMKVAYMQLPGSVAIIGKNNLTDLGFTALLDFKDMFGKMDFKVNKENDTYTLGFHNLPIFKSVLPESQMLGLFENVMVEGKNKDTVDSTVLHFEDTIMTYGEKHVSQRSYKDISLDTDEVKLLPNHGLIHYKKGTKEIRMTPVPINLRRGDRDIILYNSNGFLNKVVIVTFGKEHFFLICDEKKYLKVGIIEEDEDGVKYIKITNEYYVSETFNGSKKFTIAEGMIITKNENISLQTRGKENAFLNTRIPYAKGLKITRLPISSDDSTIYTYDQLDKSTGKSVSYMMVSPGATSSSLSIVDNKNIDNMPISYCYFYYSVDLKEEFIVYIRKGESKIVLDFYYLNGFLLCTKEIDLSDDRQMNSFEIDLSSNGKYLLLYKCYANEGFGDDVDGESDYESFSGSVQMDGGEQVDDKFSWKKMEAYIFEIVLVRSKSTHDKLQNLANKLQQNQQRDQRVKQYFKKNVLQNVKCDLKLLRTIEDLHTRCDIECKINITDVASITSQKGFYTKGKPEVYYEDVKVHDFFTRKILRSRAGFETKLKEYKWIPIKAGYIVCNNSDAFFINIKVKMSGHERELKDGEEVQGDIVTSSCSFSNICKINLQVGTLDLVIANAYECKVPNKIVFLLSSHNNEHLFVTWDLETNSEIKNYTTQGKFNFVRGENSETGYILENNCYVNLDLCLPNHYIQYSVTKNLLLSDGYKVNRTEE